MRIKIANHIGFCSGVKRAIAIAEKALKEDQKPIQFLGSLVHNEKVIEKFRKKGVRFIKDLKEAKPGTLIIQAHGIAPFSLKNKADIIIRDATCPLVKRVQLIANSFFKKGYQVIIIGDKEHAETRGIKGYTENEAIIMESKREAKKLPHNQKIGIVSQTTQSLENVNQILKSLKKIAKTIKYINTLCPEVINRQKELNEIIKKNRVILVLGSKSSANTRRLAEKARELKKKVFWVNSLEELKKINLKRISTLGVVSGTSTPNWEISKIQKWLKEKKPE